MALDGDLLGLAIMAQVDAVDNKADRAEVFKALGRAVAAQLKATAVIVGTANGVTSGGASAPIVGVIT